ncbi:MAG: TlpA family protein disulfide reductase [Clostridiales Family XIII bacterium]|jgi:thiol-disulfide isomerase/thioredoxin|nr:TlpA family protein disulfide reductase [Clostridiales Family XIII bacterium]
MSAGVLVIVIAVCGMFVACDAGESDVAGGAKSDSEISGSPSGPGGAGEDTGSGTASGGIGEDTASGDTDGATASGDAGQGVASSDADGDIAPDATGTAAWLFDISTTDINGGAFDAAALRENRITVLNLWATWCPPCVEELPALAELQEAYHAKGVQVVGVLIDAKDDGAIAAANTLLEDASATFPSIIPETFLDSNLVKGVEYVPTTLLVDADGNVIDTVVGGNDFSSWSKIIEDAFAGLDDH